MVEGTSKITKFAQCESGDLEAAAEGSGEPPAEREPEHDAEPPEPVLVRTCTGCRRTLPLSAWYPRRQTGGCRECRRAAGRASVRKYREKAAAK